MRSRHTTAQRGAASALATRSARGELRVATGDDLAVSSDPIRKPYEVIVWGLGETLMRISPRGKLVPWLAEGLENIDALTWRVTLRPHARFWDGTPVTPQAVAAAFRANWQIQPDVASLISPHTQIGVVDDRTLEFRTPHPVGNFPNALAYHQFVVNKDGGATMTGPYRPIGVQIGT
jgi:ABC-type transport system substrate-binding protein